jgi:hypothetical protein
MLNYFRGNQAQYERKSQNFPWHSGKTLSKALVVLKIDLEKNGDTEHELPVGYWIENIVTDILFRT